MYPQEIMEDGGGVAELEGYKPDNLQKNNHRYHHRRLIRQVSRVAMFMGLILVMLFVLYSSTNPFQVFPRWSSSSWFSTGKGEGYKLNDVLKKAAMKDNTVILTSLNEAWAAPDSVFDIFLESFKIGNGTKGLLNHLVVIALDQKAYKRCLVLHPHCYFLRTNGENFSGLAVFMSTKYLEMMWRRILFLRSVLELGYNFVFTDVDIMWFRDPFPHFYSDSDFQIACDFFFGNPSDMHNHPNGGFNFVKSNNHTIQFYEFWYTSRATYPQFHDQDVLNKIKFDPFVSEIGVKIKFLDTKYFGGFCQPSKDLNKVCTMHANCCIGLHKKLHDLKVLLADWRKFFTLSNNVTASRQTSWTVPQKCREALKFNGRELSGDGEPERPRQIRITTASIENS